MPPQGPPGPSFNSFLFHNLIPAQAFSKLLLRFVLGLGFAWGRACVPMWDGMASMSVTWKSWL